MLKQIERILYGVPFGFPMGWVAARISEGNYGLALWDIGCIFLIALPIIVLTRWAWRKR